MTYFPKDVCTDIILQLSNILFILSRGYIIPGPVYLYRFMEEEEEAEAKTTAEIPPKKERNTNIQ